MTRFGAFPGAVLGLVAAGLPGCTTGRQFSIAMTSPTAAQTVLVVGDDGSGSSEVVSAAAPAQTSLAASLTGVARAASNPASAGRSQRSVALAVAPTRTVTAALSTAFSIPAPSQTPIVQVASSAPTAQLSIAGRGAGPSGPISGLQATLSSPAAATSAGVAAAGAIVAAQASTPVASASATAGAAAGLQATVTSPAAGLVPGTLASSVAPVRAVLAGVASAVSLAAPSPGSSTPAASLLKTLTSAAGKKLKHG